jgi:hypothetical protein
MKQFLALIMPVGEGPVDPGFGGGVPAGPSVSPPIYLPPGKPVYPTHPIFIENPEHPENPIVLPPGTPIAPVYPVQLPVCPGSPVVIPPGTPITIPPGIDNSLPTGPVYPSHPIVIHPPQVDAGLPSGPPVYPGNALPPTAQPKRK